MSTGVERRAAKIRNLALLIVQGKTIKAAAEELGVSRQTAQMYAPAARRLIADGAVVDGVVPAGPSEQSPESGPEMMTDDAKLAQLRAAAQRGLEVGPEWAIVASRKVQVQAMVELESKKLNAREAAQALSAVDMARRNAEASIDLRAKLMKEVCAELLWVVRRVAGQEAYERVLTEFRRHGAEVSG